MTFAESLALLEKLKVAGGQAHTDDTDEHDFHSVSLDLNAVTRIEFSVRVRKHQVQINDSGTGECTTIIPCDDGTEALGPTGGTIPCDYGE